MSRFLLVCLGGALGTGARYLVGSAFARVLGPAFPWGTLTVNVIGSLLLGAIMEAAVGRGGLCPDLRVILSAGVMGGFTTYSSFNYETLAMLRGGHALPAMLYVGATLLGCFAAAVLGVALIRAGAS